MIISARFLTFKFTVSEGYPFHYFTYWYCFWAPVKGEGGKKYWGSLALNLEMYSRLIYLLTAVGVAPGGSSTVHIYLHTNCTQNSTINLVRVSAVPCLCEFYPCDCLTAEDKVRKTLRQGSRTVPVGTVKTDIQERAYITIRIH